MSDKNLKKIKIDKSKLSQVLRPCHTRRQNRRPYAVRTHILVNTQKKSTLPNFTDNLYIEGAI